MMQVCKASGFTLLLTGGSNLATYKCYCLVFDASSAYILAPPTGLKCLLEYLASFLRLCVHGDILLNKGHVEIILFFTEEKI